MDGHSSEVCTSQDERECRSAATEEGDSEIVEAGDSSGGQDQEPGVAHEAVGAGIMGVADAKQSPLGGASLGGGHCAAVDGHSSEAGASQDERVCRSAATEEGDQETVNDGDSPSQDQDCLLYTSPSPRD